MTLLEEIAQSRTNEVVYLAISLTIEKIATEVTRELLREPAFKEELKAMARQSLGRAFRDLHQNGKRPRRRVKR